VYKKLVFSADATNLLGGVLVGDATEYGALLALYKSGKPLSVAPAELMTSLRSDRCPPLSQGAAVCSCNNVNEVELRAAIRSLGLSTLAEIKQRTRAGTGCGGCLPQVAELLKAELKAAGKKVNNHLCEHFPYSRQELFQIVKVERLK